tara:strand:+ start:59 stop:403 length:345 start_codon:yes stop_codon:yes gene_type:complete
MEDNNSIYFIFYFYILLFIIILFIILQIKYINNNDNFRQDNKSLIKVTKYFKDIGLNKEEAEIMTTLFKQLKLLLANTSEFNIDEYVNKNVDYNEYYYSKKLYKNIIKNIIKNS